jgi:hypothetical protein
VPPTREDEPVAFETGAEEGPPVGTGGSIPATRIVTVGPPAPSLLRSARLPETTRGVWIEYEGARWEACGKAEPFDEATFQQAGSYRGYPVYAHKGVATSERIYMPSLPGFVAPYWRGSVTRDPSGNCERVAQVALPD